MPSLKRAFLVLDAALMATFLALSLSPGLSHASPAPIPFPLMDADYSHNELAGTRFVQDTSRNRTKSEMKHSVTSGSPVQPRHNAYTNSAVNVTTSGHELDARLLDFFDVLGGYCTTTSSKATNFHEFLTNSPVDSNNEGFQNACVGHLTDLYELLGNMHTALLGLDAQKGLANYDPSSGLETTIKDVVNYVKDLLSELCNMVDNSVLGGSIGKLVYDIKCLTDEILNATENLTDFVLSDLALSDLAL